MLKILLTFALLTSSAFAGAGEKGHSHSNSHGLSFGKEGNPKKPFRIITLVMSEGDGKMFFTPNRIEIKRNEQILFKLENLGELDHEIVIDTLKNNLAHAKEMEKNPDMEHDDPNAKRLKPKTKSELLWHFTKAGELDFSCLIPGHREAGMTGTIIVK